LKEFKKFLILKKLLGWSPKEYKDLFTIDSVLFLLFAYFFFLYLLKVYSPIYKDQKWDQEEDKKTVHYSSDLFFLNLHQSCILSCSRLTGLGEHKGTNHASWTAGKR
jgi:hypothetical protein